ncbi:related to pH-response regulator protein palF/RIM8 [Cephalotrichum gorgonifer]|uniref:Related to pH-response regulator protein palF/RIM8 n=1 Tax=Cephalotrichum gorgonifer TaxID=2041049 RepID=A0AAE8SQP9_9PEZI|nr:related to pH-response regulator protein palF/RIM8 [Cephalotrichum gorgonifer]
MGMRASQSPPEDSSSSSRSLLSRFILPLRSVKRTLDDFHIRPDEPHRTYSAGDHVRGAVVLTVTKPIRITHLVVKLHGFVRVAEDGKSAVSSQPVLPGMVPPVKGYATLFEDDRQVLSGDGRLEVGRYEFRFDLKFPDEILPSSIDFAQGTISYNISATLTRPTTISPTIQCDRKVSLMEKVDVGLVNPPRQRTIFLEPISKKTRRKNTSRHGRRSAVREPVVEPSSDVDSVGPSTLSEDLSLGRPQSVAQTGPAQVDTRSIVSGDSNFSGSTGASRTTTDVLSQASSPTVIRSASLAKLQAVDAKTITATIDLPKGGYLPGDTIPVRVTVQHIKRIKSMHGVIVTLYRMGRLNPSGAQSSSSNTPTANSQGSWKKSSRSTPKTTTIYRKDLCQTMAPLLIDPKSLSTVVSVSVKVPEDSFPTIRGVPRELLTFRYHVEVIVDLGGRLEGQLQGSGAGPQTRSGVFTGDGGAMEGGNSMYTSWLTNVVNTDHLRTEKGVIYDGIEIVVGTVDSTRLRGKVRRTLSHPNASSTSQEEVYSPQRGDAPEYPNTNGNHYPTPRLPSSNYTTTPPPPPPDEHPSPALRHPHSPPPPPPPLPATHQPAHSRSPPSAPAPEYVPRANLPDVNNLSEKERVRWQEQLLLPSRPPQGPSEAAPTAPSPSDPGPSASAPSAPLGENIYDADDARSAPSAPSAPPPDDPAEPEGPSAPTLDDVEAPLSPNEPDKLEVERQRLMNEASAPPEFPSDSGASGSGGGVGSSSGAGQASTEEPSAPVLPDEEEYGAHYAYSAVEEGRGGGSSEPLPRYER